MKRRSYRLMYGNDDPQSESPLRLWALRALFALGSGRLDKRGVTTIPEETWRLLGVSEPDEKKPAALESTREKLADLIQNDERAGFQREGQLFENVARLGRVLGLSDVERDLLALAVSYKTSPALQGAFSQFPLRSARRAYAVLAAILRVSPDEIAKALHRDAVLAHCGLLRVKIGDGNDLPLTALDDLEDVLLSESPDDQALLSRFFVIAKEPAIGRDDVPHLRADLELIVRVIQVALKTRAKGVNILLHGAPGTGKTELARLIAQTAGVRMYEVNVADSDGDPLRAVSRLASLRVCQQMLSRSEGALVLFDEIEDVFSRSFDALFGLKKSSGGDKGWFNKILDEAAVPSIWIGNHVDQIDGAFLRRFDLVVEVRTPPPSVRRKVLERHTDGLRLSHALLEHCAKDERIVPGLVERASRVARLSGGLSGASEADTQLAFKRSLEGSLTVLHGKGLGDPRPNAGIAYDVSFVNASEDAAALAGALSSQKRGIVLLYGPPGTGKTAFVKHIAERAGLPLLMKRASDLISMWVGGTEKALADAFRQARDERAILFIDEGDSFLQDRRRAQRSWEVTQVNELLVQMEHFAGLLFMATNLVEDLDQAAFRRFALKVRFEPLRLEQRAELFERLFARFARSEGLPSESRGAAERPEKLAPDRAADRENARVELAHLDRLTPGDYAAVERRFSLLGAPASRPELAKALLAALGEEHRMKDGGARRRVGFS